MNMNLHLIPGPMDDRVLYLGAEHRARNLFLNPQKGESCTMDFRRGDDGSDCRETKTEQVDADDYSNSTDESDEIEKIEIYVKEEENNGSCCEVEQTVVFPPNPQFPKPEAPSGVLIVYTEGAKKSESLSKIKRSNSSPESDIQKPEIGKFFRDKSNSLSAAISKRLSLLTNDNGVDSYKRKVSNVTELNLSGFKVTKELIERTGSSVVPQIFFNEKLLGGLVALNSLRNCGLFDERMNELLCRKCHDDAPAPPVYGFDDPEEKNEDGIIMEVRLLRQRLPIQDRLIKMKIVKNCFSASETVEVLIHQFGCGRKKAVEMGKQLARRHFIHHVFRENEFEDGNHFYRFLEHEPFIPRCHNFRGSINDLEPKSATLISQKLAKIMSAIVESYASEDGFHLDYMGISNSEEFRRYVNLIQDLQRVDISTLKASERLAFFLNLHNAMVIHGVISVGHPGTSLIDRRSFNSDFLYIIGGSPFSVTTIVDGVLRCNGRAPYSFTKPFGSGDKRLELVLPQSNPLIQFGICNGSKSSPPVRFFTPHAVESELKFAAREFLQRDGIQVDLAKRTVRLTRIFKWFSADFGQEKEILRWIIGYLDATKAGLLSHLTSDGGVVHIV
ncbi:hypothetical protein R6Q59_002498 [Mikania micrantha]